ncbi:low specificity L-threonine aldolase [Candidatus Sulfidibacterium hydrothermale]|uniref:threonine aldolase family protein n=1 Tax=Candidatus Sulfidibacterium hydrothermale TaxID=2875962 RepID=UPI001F0A0708|nr:low specificity L-threonine aldolase [Candidatus Sulfidibacterium hydrothermale]UBM62347.1 low specificity L-threonine aldolase [Candidatus Sulfidibacterium hydrothermale]
MNKINKSFASDNWSGVCPEVVEALLHANTGHVEAYGEENDFYTNKAVEKFKELLGENIRVFFVYNGTAANVLGISHVLRPHQAVVAAKSAHLNEDECGAIERFGSVKILEIETENGKITAEQIQPFLHSFGFQHHVQPRVISISEVTEKGTVYRPEEIKSLADFAHQHNMLLHVDGARIANAAVSLGVGFKELIADAGVDVLSFGGTKNGLMFGEAVVFFNEELANDFQYTRKQGMQLHSKMRFISVQFERYLTDELWKKNAERANRMARLLAERLRQFSAVQITRSTDANGVFAIIPESVIPELQKHYFFHIWDETTGEVRLMCSWDTEPEDIDAFTSVLAHLLPE